MGQPWPVRPAPGEGMGSLVPQGMRCGAPGASAVPRKPWRRGGPLPRATRLAPPAVASAPPCPSVRGLGADPGGCRRSPRTCRGVRPPGGWPWRLPLWRSRTRAGESGDPGRSRRGALAPCVEGDPGSQRWPRACPSRSGRGRREARIGDPERAWTNARPWHPCGQTGWKGITATEGHYQKWHQCGHGPLCHPPYRMRDGLASQAYGRCVGVSPRAPGLGIWAAVSSGLALSQQPTTGKATRAENRSEEDVWGALWAPRLGSP